MTLILVLSALVALPVEAADSFSVNSVIENHVAGLNSDMPYVAGFHVNAEDLSQREVVNATAITISFPSTDPAHFGSGNWLGGGMFVQGQDTHFRNVDYGFYMMLVLDASGRLFVDVGLHQTEEATAPIQTCRSNLVYAYTWQIIGINTSTPVILQQCWDNNATIHYSISALDHNQTLLAQHIPSQPNCQNIIPKFYAGNVVLDPFPLSKVVNYFQFGIISNRIIKSTRWRVYVKEPKMLRQTGWAIVDKAWTTQGDHSYLDNSLMWGGRTCPEVEVKNDSCSILKPYEAIFQYVGQKQTTGKVLWDMPNANNPTALYATQNQELTQTARHDLPAIIAAFGATITGPFLLVKRKRPKSLPQSRTSND